MKKISARNLKEKDYEILSEWWKFWWKQPVPRHALPDDISNGILISFNNKPVCAGFIYKTSSSKLFWIEFVISSNKIKNKELRSKSLDYLIKVLVELCKRDGAKTIFSSVKHQSLINKYLENGFIKGDQGMTNLIHNI